VGSSNIELGVNVSYADINNTAGPRGDGAGGGGQVRRFSYGTHFFLDLVEAQIIYLPVYPKRPGGGVSTGDVQVPSECTDCPSPDAERFCGERPASSTCRRRRAGASPVVVADPQSQRAVCYLE